jgi:putative membrane protein
MSVLTHDETKRVEATIAEVEHTTAAEIVVATIQRADHYVDLRLWLVIAKAVSAAVFVHLVWPELQTVWLLWLQFGAGFLAWFASGFDPVLRRLISRQRAQAAVERAAELAFLEHGMFATKARTGVLILLSELEHKVAILGDEGIHARVQTQGWNELVAQLVSSIRRAQPGEGLCDAIRRLGQFLAGDVPPEAENPNELDNRVRTEPRK